MKNLLVSGGSGGIGREVCYHFLNLGYRVIFFYNQNLEVAKQLQNLGAIGYKVDITNEQGLSLALCDIKKKYGAIFTVVNCAGITKRKMLQDCTEKDFDDIFSVNVKGVVNVCKSLIWDLIETKGNVINISSIWASRPASCEVLYSASKGAIESFTRSLAEELSFSGVKVNAISPGYVDTAINKGVTQKELQDFLQDNGLSRVVKATEIAKLCEQVINGEDTGKIYEIFGN